MINIALTNSEGQWSGIYGNREGQWSGIYMAVVAWDDRQTLVE